jgi:hypothetical protein
MSDLQETPISIGDKYISGETFVHTMILHSCIKIFEKNEAAIINNFNLVGFGGCQIAFVNELKEILTHVYEEIEEIPRLITCHIKEAQIKIVCLLPYTEALKWFVIGSFAANTRPFNLDDRDIISLRGLLKIANYYQKLLIAINTEIAELDNICNPKENYVQLTTPIVQTHIDDDENYICRIVVDKDGRLIEPTGVIAAKSLDCGPFWKTVPKDAFVYMTEGNLPEHASVYRILNGECAIPSSDDINNCINVFKLFKNNIYGTEDIRAVIIKEYNLKV